MKNFLVKPFAAIVFALGVLAMVFMLASCQTPRQIAQRKLRKALRIDPTVITTLDKDTTILRQLRIPYVVKVPEVARESQGYNVDSLIRILNNLPAPTASAPKAETFLYQDSVASISVFKKKDGKVAVSFNVAPRLIHDTLRYIDTLRVNMPAVVINRDTKAAGWTYFWFWGFLVALILETILYIRLWVACKGDRKDDSDLPERARVNNQ